MVNNRNETHHKGTESTKAAQRFTLVRVSGGLEYQNDHPLSRPYLSLVVVCPAICLAQTPAKEATASVAGHVTMRGKAAPAITVVATLRNSFFDNKTVAKTTTDEDGNYKLTGLTAGQFTILPLAKAYVVASGTSYKEAGQSVNVAEGEAVTKIDFVLVRGGVITGRITDSDGHPVIGERVNIALKDGSPDPGAQFNFGSNRYQTDDRGIYRMYGLGPGSYRVSVGQASAAGGAASIMGIGGSPYARTFYPSVEDESRATIIEIKEGAEISNIDITVNKPGKGFSVSGRVIDADSGAPAAKHLRRSFHGRRVEPASWRNEFQRYADRCQRQVSYGGTTSGPLCRIHYGGQPGQFYLQRAGYLRDCR